MGFQILIQIYTFICLISLRSSKYAQAIWQATVLHFILWSQPLQYTFSKNDVCSHLVFTRKLFLYDFIIQHSIFPTKKFLIQNFKFYHSKWPLLQTINLQLKSFQVLIGWPIISHYYVVLRKGSQTVLKKVVLTIFFI